MIQSLDIDAFLNYATEHNIPVLDVRAPKEFNEGHIPAAQSLPLFTDEERKQVGTTYKQINKDQAVLLGLDLFGPKMSEMVRQAEKLAPGKEVMLHCWRGGMRSAGVAWLLDLAGFKVNLLRDGYKAFRRLVKHTFAQPMPLMVIGGLTGSGKTEILQELQKLGENIIDLEKLAHHRGSAFGGIGQPSQPSVEQFENELGLNLLRFQTANRIWLEDENSVVGRLNLPVSLYNQMQQAPLIKLEIPKMARIQKLAADYRSADKELLQQAIERIKKRLGGLAYKEALTAIDTGDMEKMVEIALVYYDKAYSYQLDLKPADKITTVALPKFDPPANAREILEVVQKLKILK
ncbi:tRNA 2-selenouridine(34) synthase MnmH [Adhaeribacter radiodurans]|uniref:tRNA 2-selenouridine(34) synthase MnmH n=1 Tax=Adhaeribacter radiodurans TaxID=2745197 RepID=A0A7L7L2G4_9BACT|nr:tRNA 2-selenouridine(34) synthase MnmH [Adhaeribacter radiodurans]QMU26984.1 tRNA 2-selenouridine(34) synthase MnmH [Adhaeribacter radiodurans]